MKELQSVDLLWLLLCTGQVLLMQAGFCLLESGMARAKNSINVAIKNLIDFCVSAFAFWLVGSELLDLMSQMNRHRRKGAFHQHVTVEPFTELGPGGRGVQPYDHGSRP